jgi:hypothetical protein
VVADVLELTGPFERVCVDPIPVQLDVDDDDPILATRVLRAGLERIGHALLVEVDEFPRHDGRRIGVEAAAGARFAATPELPMDASPVHPLGGERLEHVGVLFSRNEASRRRRPDCPLPCPPA